MKSGFLPAKHYDNIQVRCRFTLHCIRVRETVHENPYILVQDIIIVQV